MNINPRIIQTLMGLLGFAGSGGLSNINRQFNGNPLDNPSLEEWIGPIGQGAMFGLMGGLGGAAAAQGAKEGVSAAIPKIAGGSGMPAGLGGFIARMGSGMGKGLNGNFSPLQTNLVDKFSSINNNPLLQRARGIMGGEDPYQALFRMQPTIPNRMGNVLTMGGVGASTLANKIGAIGLGNTLAGYPRAMGAGLASMGGLALGGLMPDNNQSPTSTQQLTPEQQMILMQLMQQQGRGY